MTKKQEFELVAAVANAIAADLCDPSTGDFKPASISSYLKLGADIEAAYKAMGGSVPADVDKVLAGVDALAAIFGKV